MDRIKSVLVFIDPRVGEHPAIAKAARIAAGFRARLVLSIVEPSSAACASNFLDAATCRLAQDRLILPHRGRLETLAEPLRDAGLTVDTEVVLETPLAAAMLAQIKALRPSLVVMDTHPHSLLRRAFLSHLDWFLLRESPAPLLLAKPRAWGPGPLHIAGAVDPGHPDDKPWSLDHEILGTLEYLSTGFPCELSVVNAFCSLEEFAELGTGGSPEYAASVVTPVAAARRQQADALRQLLAGHQLERERVHLVEGSPVEALPSFVSHHRIDLLVMGVISRGRLFEHFIGSTAERMLDEIECDVLALKPESLAARLW
ncbi:MAG: universal stress protein [Steroidobacteraceae bacterium]